MISETVEVMGSYAKTEPTIWSSRIVVSLTLWGVRRRNGRGGGTERRYRRPRAQSRAARFPAELELLKLAFWLDTPRPEVERRSMVVGDG